MPSSSKRRPSGVLNAGPSGVVNAGPSGVVTSGDHV